jgi:MBG domain/Kelch motif/Galactose oxidase, central domain
METKSSVSVASITGRAGLRLKQSVTVVMVVLMSMFYAVICQAQILGTGQLNSARRSHTATLLQDGKILVVGGDAASGLVGHAEIFDPASLTSSNIAANPIALRTDHTATLLADGRVLIIGGVDGNGSLASTEFYSPYSVPAPAFSAGPPLQRTRSGHTSTVLANGKILIIGGDASGSAEIYDPATQTFSLVSGSLNTPRQYHSAALLNSGKILIVGGVVGTNTVLNSAEIYDPQTQTFTPASGPMQTPRGLALLRVLPDGKVQVIGGDGEFSMEMFDPATNSFIALAHIPPHEDHLDSIITSRTRSALITTIIQQNPVLQGQPELTPQFIALLNRLDHTVTEIPQSNRALIAGGVNDAGQILSSATLVSSSAATITTDKFDYAPGDIVTITGQGWQPNETVWMLFHEEPETHPDVVTSSVANSEGSFTNANFAPAENDLNRNFTLTAIGQTSGFTAQTAFKDAINLQGVSIGSQSPIVVLAGTDAMYSVTPNFNGSGLACTATFSVSGLPVNATVTGSGFIPTSISSSSPGSSTLTIHTTGVATGTHSFTVNAVGSGGCSGTKTATGTLRLGKYGTTIVWQNDNPDPSTTVQMVTAQVKLNHEATPSGTPEPKDVVAGTGAGTISISDGFDSCIINVSGLNNNGIGSCGLTLTTVGARVLNATFSGNDVYQPSGPVGESHSVTAAGTAPTITSSNNTTFTVGTAGSFTVTTTGSPAPALTKSGALPTGVTFTDNGNGTATLSGTPLGTVGSYPITITANNGVSPNATQNFTLTVQKATPTATLAVSNSPQTYNGSPQAATVVISVSSVPGAVANVKYDGSATAPTNAGTYAVTADFVPTDDANYNTLTGLSAGNFVIQKATPIIIWNNPADITYPTAVSAAQLNANANVAGSFVYTPPAGTLLSVGSGQTLHVDFTPADSLNYNNASKNVLINVIYNFTGFFRPIDNLPMLNITKAGSAVPVKFSLNGNQGLSIFAGGYPTSGTITCNSTDLYDYVEETVTAGGSSLSYDASANQYVYVWKTEKSWAGSCRQLVVKLSDGTYHRANFNFSK